MAKIPNPQRIIVEDYPEEHQDTVSRLATTLNYFMENVFNVLNNNVDFGNLRQERIYFRVTVDINGNPLKTTQFSSTLISSATDCIVVYARNRNTPTNYPDAMPLVSFNPQGGGIYKVLNVAGIQANEEYDIRIILLP